MGSLFKKPKMPEAPPPTPFLIPDEIGLKRAKRRKLAELTSRSGRLSTVLSQEI